MAPITQGRDVIIPWDGKTHSVRVDYELIDLVEQQLCIYTLAERMRRKEVRISQQAKLVAIALKHAGCVVSPSDVLAKMTAGSAVVYIECCSKIIKIALEPPENLGNDGAPAQGQSPQPSDGQSTTRSPSGTSGSSQASSGG